MPGQIHQQRVGELVASGARVRGWRDAVRDLLDPGCRDQVPRFVPDAFRIDADRRTVTAYEVMVTHFVGDEKLLKYAELWFLLDAEDAIDLRLVWVAETGAQRDVDLCAVFYGEVLGGRHIGTNGFDGWLEERAAS